VLDGVGDHVVPRFAGLHDEPSARALDPAGPDRDDVAVPAGVGSHDVGAAAEQQQWASGLVGVPDGGDQLRGVLDLDDPVGDAADAQGGEAGQPDLAENLHDPTLAGTTLRTGE
jgi:hypothetical protein